MSIDYDSSRSIVFHSVCICSVQYKRETYRIPTFPTMKISFSSFIQFGNEGKGKRERKTKILKEKEEKWQKTRGLLYRRTQKEYAVQLTLLLQITALAYCSIFNFHKGGFILLSTYTSPRSYL